MNYYRFTKLVYDREIDTHHEEPITLGEIAIPKGGLMKHLNELNYYNSKELMENKTCVISFYETPEDKLFNDKI